MKHFLTAALAALAICAQAQVLATAPKDNGDSVPTPFIISKGSISMDVPKDWNGAPIKFWGGYLPEWEFLPIVSESPVIILSFGRYTVISKGNESTPHPCDWVHNTAFEYGCPVRDYRICRVCLRYESRDIDLIERESDFWELFNRLDLGSKKN